MASRRLWTEEEDKLIKDIVEQSKELKWAQILKNIKKVNPNFDRTSKQIRERWKFYLDPTLTNDAWTEEEQEIIFRSHVLKGSKWKQIQKLLTGRSEKAIKNFFYMTLRKSIRRISKILGVKNSTDQSREIKPQVLTKVIQSLNEAPEKRQTIYRMFRLPKIRSGSCRHADISKEDKQIYRQILDDLITYNDLYAVDKKKGLQALQQKLIHIKNENGMVQRGAEKQVTQKGTHATQLELNEQSNIHAEQQLQFQQQEQPQIKRDESVSISYFQFQQFSSFQS